MSIAATSLITMGATIPAGMTARVIAKSSARDSAPLRLALKNRPRTDLRHDPHL